MEPNLHDMEKLEITEGKDRIPLLCTEIKNTGFQFPMWRLQLDESMPGFVVYKPIHQPYVCCFCFPRTANKYCDHIAAVHARNPFVVQEKFLPEDEEWIESTLRTIVEVDKTVIEVFDTEAKYQLMSVMSEDGRAFVPPYFKPIPVPVRQHILDKENLWDQLIAFYEHNRVYNFSLFQLVQNLVKCNYAVTALKEAIIKSNELERICIAAALKKEEVIKVEKEDALEVEKEEV